MGARVHPLPVALSLVIASGVAIAAQTPVTELGLCLTDSLVARRASVLPDGPEGLLGEFEPIAQGSRGDLFVRFFDGPPVIRRFDASYEYQGDVGREGQGPGEYLWPTSILADQESGEILVADSRQRRLIRFASDGTFLGQVTTPFQVFVRGLWRVDEERFLVNGSTPTPPGDGRNVFLVHGDSILQTFQTRDGLPEPGAAVVGQRRLLVLSRPNAPLRFIAAHRRKFRLDLYETGPSATRSFLYTTPWFEPWTRYGITDPNWVPPPFVADLIQVGPGLVGVVVNRVRDQWRDGVEVSSDGSTRIVDGSRTYEASIHVVDLGRGCVRSEGTVPIQVSATLNGELVGLRLDQFGRPSIEFWSIELVPIQ
ncbi:MAG: 6-bladed beta-propeller [Gemmatimonadetes bacterium]|nr:6-bladed beta-propeller [Gemmatimonadota bacterium]